MRQTVIFMIMGAMMLHCASRTGLLSHLYQQRHHIAYTLGLIDEVPIAVCSSDYDFRHAFIIHQIDNDAPVSQQTLPTAAEIKLFFVTPLNLVASTHGIAIVSNVHLHVAAPLRGCAGAVFHPPAVCA